MVIKLSPRSFINLNDKTIDILYPGRGTMAVAKGKITNKISIEYEHIRYALMRSGDLCLVMKNNSTMFSIKPAETFTIQGDRKRLEELLQKLNPLIKEI
jgi:hypothetical protein